MRLLYDYHDILLDIAERLSCEKERPPVIGGAVFIGKQRFDRIRHIVPIDAVTFMSEEGDSVYAGTFVQRPLAAVLFERILRHAVLLQRLPPELDETMETIRRLLNTMAASDEEHYKPLIGELEELLYRTHRVLVSNMAVDVMAELWKETTRGRTPSGFHRYGYIASTVLIDSYLLDPLTAIEDMLAKRTTYIIHDRGVARTSALINDIASTLHHTLDIIVTASYRELYPHVYTATGNPPRVLIELAKLWSTATDATAYRYYPEDRGYQQAILTQHTMYVRIGSSPRHAARITTNHDKITIIYYDEDELVLDIFDRILTATGCDIELHHDHATATCQMKKHTLATIAALLANLPSMDLRLINTEYTEKYAIHDKINEELEIIHNLATHLAKK